jgi:hypothetical protein
VIKVVSRRVLTDEKMARLEKGWESEWAIYNLLPELIKQRLIAFYFWASGIPFLDNLGIDFIIAKEHPWIVPLQVKSSYGGLIAYKSDLIKRQPRKINEMEGRVYYADEKNELCELTEKEILDISSLAKGAYRDLFVNFQQDLNSWLADVKKAKRILFLFNRNLYELTRGLLSNIPTVVVCYNDSEEDLLKKMRKIIKDWERDWIS